MNDYAMWIEKVEYNDSRFNPTFVVNVYMHSKPDKKLVKRAKGIEGLIGLVLDHTREDFVLDVGDGREAYGFLRLSICGEAESLLRSEGIDRALYGLAEKFNRIEHLRATVTSQNIRIEVVKELLNRSGIIRVDGD